ncbi:Hypothetical predicted protein [Marmota monax]|uniref:Uncharacterized protein n=1 Tax=Marmota monax TaxID=9995 RepID=A0A5E4ADB7_MARMO|nr:Hypothetical predicted protein [Marmota monax]
MPDQDAMKMVASEGHGDEMRQLQDLIKVFVTRKLSSSVIIGYRVGKTPWERRCRQKGDQLLKKKTVAL